MNENNRDISNYSLELPAPHACFLDYDKSLKQLKANKQNMGLQEVNIAVFANVSLKHILDIMDLWLAKDGFNAKCYEFKFNVHEQELLNKNSQFYRNKIDVVFFFATYHDFLYLGKSIIDWKNDKIIKEYLKRYLHLWRIVKKNTQAKIFQSNVAITSYRLRGNFDSLKSESFINLCKNFNEQLKNLAELENIFLLDQEFLAAQVGKLKWFDERQWYADKYPMSFDVIGTFAHAFSRLFAATVGASKKCIVLDLDNVLWGGAIGEDGLEGIRLGQDVDGEAFVTFQSYLKGLQKQGIMLAVCSKNERDIAILPFEKHPDMILKLDDISSFKVSYKKTKAELLLEIAEELFIGIHSIVFVDDSPFERELVKKFLPELEVFTLPEDPAEFIIALSCMNYFETTYLSKEDSMRTEMIKAQQKIEDERKKIFKQSSVKSHEMDETENSSKYQDMEEFLENLEMEVSTVPWDNFYLPRIVQLVNKTTQFNLNGKTYTEASLREIIGKENYFTFAYRLKDKFIDYGVVAVLIATRRENKIFSETFVLSCRVFERGLEKLVLNELIKLAHSFNIKELILEAKRTGKNNYLFQVFKELGFSDYEDGEDNKDWLSCRFEKEFSHSIRYLVNK